jgi:hypothetical protein
MRFIFVVSRAPARADKATRNQQRARIRACKQRSGYKADIRPIVVLVVSLSYIHVPPNRYDGAARKNPQYMERANQLLSLLIFGE